MDKGKATLIRLLGSIAVEQVLKDLEEGKYRNQIIEQKEEKQIKRERGKNG